MKPQHRPLVAHVRLSTFSFVLLLASFILLLLVGISLTIVKSVYLLRVYSIKQDQPATSIATELRFGVWGVCASSVLNAPTLLTNNGDCFGPKLGYDIPEYITSLIDVPTSLVDAILTGVLVFLVLHLVSAGFAFVAFLSSLFLASHGLSILCLVVTIISALLTTVAFGLNLALVIAAKNQVPSLTENGFAVAYGNGVWMVLTAMICTWAAVVLLSARVCYCCGVRRHHHYDHYDPKTSTTTSTTTEAKAKA